MARMQVRPMTVAAGLVAGVVSALPLAAQVVNDLSDSTTWPRCRVDPTPVMRIGVRMGAPSEMLDGVEDADMLPDGSVVLVNRGSKQARRYGADGSFLQSYGRAGEGPGEFRDPIEVDPFGRDSVAVWDWAQARIIVFPLDGDGARTIRLEPPPPNPTGRFEVVEGDARFIVGFHEVRMPPPSGTPTAQRLVLARYDDLGALRDTVDILPYGFLQRLDEFSVARPRFQARGRFAVGPDGLYRASGGEPVVRRPDGSEVRWAPPGRAVTDDHVAIARTSALASATSEYFLTRIRREWDETPVMPEFPALADLRVDDAGRLWVQQYTRPGTNEVVWWLFDERGLLQCALRFTDGFDPLDFRADRVVGLVRDPLDVEYVEVRRFTEPG